MSRTVVKLISALVVGFSLSGCGVSEPQEAKPEVDTEQTEEVQQAICVYYNPVKYNPVTYNPVTPGSCGSGYTYRTGWNGANVCVSNCGSGYATQFDWNGSADVCVATCGSGYALRRDWNGVDGCVANCGSGYTAQYDWNGSGEACVANCSTGYTLTRGYLSYGDVCKASNCT